MRRAGAGPELSISREKSLRIQRAAATYARQNDIHRAIRYDIVAFAGSEISHHRNVFSDFADLTEMVEDGEEVYE